MYFCQARDRLSAPRSRCSRPKARPEILIMKTEAICPVWTQTSAFVVQNHFCSATEVWKKTSTGLWSVCSCSLWTDVSPALPARVRGEWCPAGLTWQRRAEQAGWVGAIWQSVAHREGVWGQALLHTSVLQLLSTASWSHNIVEEES